MQSTGKRILSSDRIAVAGVSRNRRKYGSIVYYNLKHKGYTVYPINPAVSSYDGQTCYKSPAELPEDVRALVCILKPEICLETIKDAAEAGITDVWLQPGAESPEILAWCDANGVNAVHNRCIMVESDFH